MSCTRIRIAVQKRRDRLLLVALAVAVPILPLAPAPADVAPYAGARTEESAQPDPVLTFGGASATATADPASGSLSVSASASEGFPVRTGTALGRSTAKATAVLIDEMPLTPGRWEITAIVSLGEPAAHGSAAAPVLANAEASVLASLGVTARGCAEGGCAPTYAPGTQSLVKRKLACVPASGACGAGSPLHLVVAVEVPPAGDAYIEVTLEASAAAEGLASASAGAVGTVTGISASPASPPSPFTQPVPLSPRMLVDALTVDAQGAEVRSHVPLPNDKAFVIEARGPYRYSSRNDLADAECAQAGGRWTSDPIEGQPDALDLLVNGQMVPWTPDVGSARVDAPACSLTNVYQVAVVGPGDTLSFRIQDPTPLDNVGGVVVAIYLLVP